MSFLALSCEKEWPFVGAAASPQIDFLKEVLYRFIAVGGIFVILAVYTCIDRRILPDKVSYQLFIRCFL